MDEPNRVFYKRTSKHNIYEFEPYFSGQTYDGTLWAEILGCLEDELIPKEFENNIELIVIFLEQLRVIIDTKNFFGINKLNKNYIPQSIFDTSELINTIYNSFFQHKVPPINKEAYISAVSEFINQKILFHRAILSYFDEIDAVIDSQILTFIDKFSTLMQKKIKADSNLIWKYIGAIYDLNFVQIHFFLQVINNNSLLKIERSSFSELNEVKSLLNFDLLLKLYISNDMKNLASNIFKGEGLIHDNDILKRAADIYNQYKTFIQANSGPYNSEESNTNITYKDLTPFLNIDYFTPVNNTFFPDLIAIINAEGLYRSMFFNDKHTLKKWNIALEHIIASTNYHYLLRLDSSKWQSFVNLSSKEIEDILLHDKVIELSSKSNGATSYKFVPSYYNYYNSTNLYEDDFPNLTASSNSSFDASDYNSLD
jgi:hypothetical protein